MLRVWVKGKSHFTAYEYAMKSSTITCCNPLAVEFIVRPRPALTNHFLGNKKSARSFLLPRSFCAPPKVMDVRALGSWLSAPKRLFFQGFEGLPDVFDPGRPHE